MKKCNKLIIGFILAVTLFTAATTFLGNKVDAYASNAQDDPLIGVCLPNHNEYYDELAQEIVNEYIDMGYNDVITLYADNNSSTQIDQIENLINQSVSVLVVAPVDADALGYILNEADSRGIYIINIGMPSSTHPSGTVNVYWDYFEKGASYALQFRDDSDLDNRYIDDPAYLAVYLLPTVDSYYFRDGILSILQQYVDAGVLIINFYCVHDAMDVYNIVSSLLVPGGVKIDTMSFVKDFSRAARQAYEDAGYPYGQDGAKFYGENISYPAKSIAEKIAELTKKLLEGEDVATGEDNVYYIEITDDAGEQ